MPFVFYMERTDEKNPSAELLGSMEHFGAHSSDLESHDISVFSMDFALRVEGNPDLEDLKFDPFRVDFKTRKQQQKLFIDTRRLNEGVEPGKFKIIKVWADPEGTRHTHELHIKPRNSNFRMHALDQEITADVVGIYLEFKMKGVKTPEFNFYITVQDTDPRPGAMNTKPCDPQVGNDPD